MRRQSVWQFLKDFEGGFRGQSTRYIKFELQERENIFALLIGGSLMGLPSPPSSISIRLIYSEVERQQNESKGKR